MDTSKDYRILMAEKAITVIRKSLEARILPIPVNKNLILEELKNIKFALNDNKILISSS